jgi:glucosamine--fructose-6-phosphate aminotransferase (isomerizing)
MCGIVGAVAQTNTVPVLVQGLQRLEYRGYDSCGLAIQQSQGLQRSRSTARVADLQAQVQRHALQSEVGIAHTRWATHGAPAEHNAHPHFSHGPGVDATAPQHAPARVALVHNGIIENHETLRAELSALGYVFASQTDTEVVAHLIDSLYHGDLLAAVRAATARLHGAYAIAVLHANEPHHLVGARHGAPMVMGVGPNAHYLASDAMALAGVAEHVMYLEDGDCATLTAHHAQVIDVQGQPAQRAKRQAGVYSEAVELGPYRHHMQKEIFAQPQALADTLEGVHALVPDLFGPAEQAQSILSGCQRVLVLACGTSYYSGLVAKYWLEAMAGIPTQVEVASEYRYRTSVPEPHTLVVTISQSGETADTLAALQHAKAQGLPHSLTVCNVASSAMVRACSLAYLTRAGVEIGVASTKAFTTQLAGLFLLTLTLARARGRLSAEQEADWLRRMRHLPVALQAVLALEPQIMAWAEAFASKEHALFLGRGVHYPIALEGALKLKEISYIHAEAYPAGELKHGPLALVTAEMPVVTVAPNDALLEKLKSNMQEVRARGGVLYVLADADSQLSHEPGVHLLRMPEHYGALSPMLHVVPLQLLAYHTACARGTDVDKPRNLAKSVTVE